MKSFISIQHTMHRVPLFLILLLVVGGSLCLSAQSLVRLEFQDQVDQDTLQQRYPFFLVTSDIKTYKVVYTTNGVFGEPDTASGLLALPVVDNPEMELPLLVYQHGTSLTPEAIPSNPNSEERSLIEAFAAAGYATLSADYLGLGESRGFHPYGHAESAVSIALDLMRAFREALVPDSVAWNGQLYLTGYSQGGHAAMALHRAIEADASGEFSVTAGSHLSGPYSASGVMTDLALSDSAYFFPGYLLYSFLSYNYVYGLYERTEQFVSAPYVAIVDSFLNDQLTLLDFNNQLVDRLIATDGIPRTKPLLQDSILTFLTQDGHPLREALQDNDVFDWTPLAPTRILYCAADDVVPARNAIVADSVMRANGAMDLTTTDLVSDADHLECVIPALIVTVTVFNQIRSAVTNTEAAPIDDSLIVYPNPASTQLYLRGAEPGATATLFDLQGRPCLTQVLRGSEERLELPRLPNGMYVLHITGRKQMRHLLHIQQ